MGKPQSLIRNPIALIIFIVFLLIERLAFWFFAKTQVEDILFLDTTFFLYGAIFTTILLLGVTYTSRKRSNVQHHLLGHIFGESPSIWDFFGDIIYGSMIGVGFFWFGSLGGLSVLGRPFGRDIPMFNSIARYSTSRLRIIPTAEGMTNLLFIYMFNVFHVSFNEETVMAVITLLLLIALGLIGKKVLDMAATKPEGLIATLAARGNIFSGVHIFSYTREGFALDYFISATIAGMLFGFVFLWRGIVAAIFAHGTFNFLLDITTSGFRHIAVLFSELTIVLTIVSIILTLLVTAKIIEPSKIPLVKHTVR